MTYQIKQSTTAYPLLFLMVDSADHVTGKTGLSPTVTISKTGGSFASPSGSVTEIANGWYQVAGNATDTGTLGPLALHATGTGADPTDMLFEVVAYDPQDSVRLGLTSLPNAAAEAAGGLYTRGTGAGQIKQTNNGEIDANTTRLAGTAQTARDIGASVLLSTGTGTGQLDFTSGVVKANVTQNAGTNITAASGVQEVKVASIANNAITAASINADAITDAKVAADVTIASVTGSVGSVTGAVGSVAGNVGGNVTGSVGSVVGAVGSVTADVSADVTKISGDATAADNLEALLDGTGGVTLTATAFTLTTPINADAVKISTSATAADNLETALTGGSYNVGGGGIVAASVTAGVTLATSEDSYWASINFDRDLTNDEYAVTWMKNLATASSITTPTIQVRKRSDGSDLIASTAMSAVGATNDLKYTDSVNRIDFGEAYKIIVTATIDGSTRTWASKWFSRDEE